jgi:hypothetical protein
MTALHLDERRAKQLHYDIMGIALAIRAHAGESALYQEIDQALTERDWRKMVIIQNAFDMLSAERQQGIMDDLSSKDEVGYSIALFERALRMMLPQQDQRTA